MDLVTTLWWGVGLLSTPLFWLFNIPGLIWIKDLIVGVYELIRRPSFRPILRNMILCIASVAFLFGIVRLIRDMDDERNQHTVEADVHCVLASECGSPNPYVKERAAKYNGAKAMLSQMMRADSTISQRCNQFVLNCLSSPTVEIAAKILTPWLFYNNPALVISLITGFIGLSMVSWSFVFDSVSSVKNWMSHVIDEWIRGRRHKALVRRIGSSNVGPLQQK